MDKNLNNDEEKGEKMSSEEKKDELEDRIDDYKDKYEDLMESLEDIRERIEEEEEGLREIEEQIAEQYQEMDEAETEIKKHKIESKIEKLKEKKEKIKNKIQERTEKGKKIQKKVEETRKKMEEVRKKYVRMNISLPSNMKEDWKDLADDINTSVSELIRSAVGAVGPVLKNLKSLKDLEKLGESLDQWGEGLEEQIKKSGIEDIGKELEVHFDEKGGISRPKVPKPPKPSISSTQKSYVKIDMERIKKRIYGLIKLQKSLPISKLAQVLSISEEKAENLIYELAAEGIEGQLEEGVFKFTNPTEEVIEKVYELIEKIAE